MTSIVDITGSFPLTVCTPFATDAPPSHASLKTLHLELNSCATTIPSNLGGATYGHLFLCMPAATYLALPNAAAFVAPVNPGNAPIIAAGATNAFITEANRAHLVQVKTHETYLLTDSALKKLLLEAVPTTYLQTLQHETLGFALCPFFAFILHQNDFP